LAIDSLVSIFYVERRGIKSPLHGVFTNTGPLATAAWCLARNLLPRTRNWFVEVVLTAPTARFAIEIYAEEWGFAFELGTRVSWIRVTDIPFVHGQDDFGLLRETTSLVNVGRVLRSVEERYALAFPRATAAVRTNIDGGEPTVLAWVETL
jgi:hypothetical protein